MTQLFFVLSYDSLSLSHINKITLFNFTRNDKYRCCIEFLLNISFTSNHVCQVDQPLTNYLYDYIIQHLYLKRSFTDSNHWCCAYVSMRHVYPRESSAMRKAAPQRWHSPPPKEQPARPNANLLHAPLLTSAVRFLDIFVQGSQN